MTQTTASAAGGAAAPVNLYTSPDFLDVIAKVYFPGESCRAQDTVVGDQVYRLLSVNGRGPVTQQTFIDIHEPVARSSRSDRLPTLRVLPQACHELVSLDEFRSEAGSDESMGAPAILWEQFPTWVHFEDLLRSRRVIQEDQRRARRLERLLGPVNFTADDTAADVLPTCYAWKSARDQSFSRTDLFASEANRNFFPELRARGLLRTSTLRAGGRLLSIWLGAVYDQRWTGWVFAFDPDPELAKYSLGRQLLYPMLMESHRAGHREFDFSIGMEAYKLSFATHVRRIGPVGTKTLAEHVNSALKRALRRAPGLFDKARALRRSVGQARRAFGAPRKQL